MGLTNSKNYDYDNDGLLPPLSREEAIEQSLILSDLVDRYSFGEDGSIFDWGKEYRYEYSEDDMKIIRESLRLSDLM